MILSDPQYRMPAEWEPHDRTLTAWPVRNTMIHPEDYDAFCAGIAELVTAIAVFEPVTLLIRAEDRRAVEAHNLPAAVDIRVAAHDDVWVRDTGPTVVLDESGRRIGLNWQFNAWGHKYPDWELDNLLPPLVLEQLGIPRRDVPMVLEGGSIHVDGQGTLLTTRECLLHPNRNAGWSEAQIEKTLSYLLGVRTVLWLPAGLDGDETDGHVDNVAAFAAPGVVLLQTCDDPDDPNMKITERNREALAGRTDATGRPLRVIGIPQPTRRTDPKDGRRLTASYLNFCLVNNGLILPVFGGDAAASDAEAVRILSDTFPGRTVRTVDGNALLREGGNVHCATQQIPAAPAGEKGTP